MAQHPGKVNYEIRENREFASREVTFDSKPSAAVRAALKELKMRWHTVKKCWYGYASEREIIAAILGSPADEPTEIAPTLSTGGYLGGGAVYGSKSGQYLHGAELSAAIRADIKRAGIKGVSVACKTYTGGQALTVTIKAPAALIRSRADYVAAYRIPAGMPWIDTGDGPAIHSGTYWDMPAADQERIRAAAAAYAYDCAMTRCYNSVNQYHLETSADWLNADGLRLLKTVDNIIRAYHYDNSNSMVDYFDTNFYYDIHVKCIPGSASAA